MVETNLNTGDFNFVFPVRELSNERVKLVPFSNTIHAPKFHAESAPHPELFSHVPFGPFSTTDALISEFLNGRVGKNPADFVFAIIDKTRPQSTEDTEGALAGMAGYLGSSPLHLKTEIGFIIILPAFQRTHITTNAVGLLMTYAFEPPSNGGLGMRRVQYQCNVSNAASMRVAERMGFKKEGVLRWDRVFWDGEKNLKEGNGRPPPKGREGQKDLGRDTAIFACCWDDWEEGLRDLVRANVDRK